MPSKLLILFFVLTQFSYAQELEIKEPEFLTPFVFYNTDLSTRMSVQKKLESNTNKLIEGFDNAIIQKEFAKLNAYSKDLIAKREALSSSIRDINNNYSAYTQSKDIIAIRQQISDKIKAKSEFEKKFLDDLKKQTNTEGLYLIVLGSDANSLNLSSGQYKEIAQQFLVQRAVKELDGAFITSLTRIVNRTDVQTKVTSKVKGKMSLKETPFEKRRLLAKDYIMLMNVNVQPMADTIFGTAQNPNITAKNIINCKNRDDVNNLFQQLQLNETDKQIINTKIDEILPNTESNNDANNKTIQELWDNLNKSLTEIQQQIDALIAIEKDKTKKIKELTSKVTLTNAIGKNMNDTLILIEERLKDMSLKIEQRMELIENKTLFKLENREIKLNSNLSPIEALAEAIERLSKEMESAFANQFAFSEELVMQNKIIQDIKINKNFNRRKKINKVWVYLSPTNDESYKLSLISKFDLDKFEKTTLQTIQPQKTIEPEPIIKPKKKYGFDVAKQPDLTKLYDENNNLYDYFGEVKNNKPNGIGKQQFDNGNTYEGLMQEGKRNGKGTFTWTNGDIYTGNWLNDKKEGAGKITYKNGSVYEGNFVNDLMQGTGTFTWYDGHNYTGQWQQNLMEGIGTITEPYGLEIINCAGAVKYVGNFKNNQKHGKGKCYDVYDKLIYDGNFSFDFPTDIYPSIILPK